MFIPALIGLLSGVLPGQVTVKVAEPVVERRVFDPQHPPSDMPKHVANEGAVTRSNFMVNTRVGGEVVDRQRVDGEFQATLKIQRVDMDVSLSIIIWLPSDVVPKLVNHEEGHRELAERYYKNAETVARKYASALIGQTVTGRGDNYDSAGDVALKRAAEEIGHQYLGDVDLPCGRAQEIYDQITEHGTNPIKESKAIEQAVKRANTHDR